jgi:hypothetical protein
VEKNISSGYKSLINEIVKFSDEPLELDLIKTAQSIAENFIQHDSSSTCYLDISTLTLIIQPLHSAWSELL